MSTLSYSEEILVIGSFDVCVIGAGPSGLCAAAASAAAGARTLLLERYGFSGGMATAGYVGPILGVHHWGSKTRVLGGIPWKLLSMMESKGGAELNNDGLLVPFDPEVMKIEGDRLLEEAGAVIRYHSVFCSVLQDDYNRITHVVFLSKQGLQAAEVSVVVDGTGDGDAAAAAGADFTLGRVSGRTEMQPMTTVFRLVGTEKQRITGSEDAASGYVIGDIREKLNQACRQGDIPPFGGPWIMRGSTVREGEAFVNIVRQWGNPTCSEDLTRCEIQGRKDMMKLFRFLKEHVQELHQASIIDSGAQIGVRDSRHIHGSYQLKLCDVMEGRRFEDSAALGSHIIDIHSTTGTSGQQRITVPVFEIPFRAMTVPNIPNLIVTGRSISAEYEVFCSLRVMGTCMALGEAAGAAAAAAADAECSVHEVDIGSVRKHLRESGACISLDDVQQGDSL